MFVECKANNVESKNPLAEALIHQVLGEINGTSASFEDVMRYFAIQARQLDFLDGKLSNVSMKVPEIR